MALFKSLEKYKDKIALNSNFSGPITFAELVNKTVELKSIMPERSLIFLIADNKIGSVINYIASIRNNCVVILVDHRTNVENIKNLIKSYKPSLIAAPNSWIQKKYQDEYKFLRKIYDYSLYKTIYSQSKNIHKDLSILLSTSGSMGIPKFVKLSKKNLKSNTDSIIKYLSITSKEKSITNMPTNYSYMLSIINSFIESGASIFVSKNSILQKDFWKEYANEKITSFSGVPYTFEMLIKLGLENLFSPYLKTLTQAGGKLDINSTKKIISFCKNKNIKFISMYGQTEASPRMTYLKWKDTSKKIGSIGKAIPNTKIWLENDNKKRINLPNKIGELVFKGKNVFMGYSKNLEDLKKSDEKKGILKTGDLGYFDKDKFFFITGRKNRIIKIFGNRLNLDDVEEKMKQMQYEIACKEINEKFYIFFEKKFSIDNVLKNLVLITGQNKAAFNCVHLKNLPRTSSGKINYKKLKINA